MKEGSTQPAADQKDLNGVDKKLNFEYRTGNFEPQK
jgi:hypothetical protein